MANFNDQVNNYIGRYFAHRPLEIRRVDTMKAFERAISGWMNDYFNPASSEYKSKEKLASMDSVFQDGQFDEMDECDIHCSLYILYKEEHRVQKLAGRCFSWDNMEEAFIGIKGEELQLEKGRYLGNRKGFCIPRFDAMQAAVLITDYEVVAYGDSYIEADDMDEDLVHCNVYVGYGLVADIHIDTKEFDRFFGLKENFPKQYDEIFGQAKVPYADPFDAQVEVGEQAEKEKRRQLMKILKVTEDAIEFDNGKHISFDHDQDCCEINYADFEQLDSLAREVDFSEPLEFELCDYGFRFGNPPINMFFVPCYSIQNGYYSNLLNIWYGGKEVINGLECQVEE